MESPGKTEEKAAKEQLAMFNGRGDERGRLQLVTVEEAV